ncbi:MAG: hypothetical protein HQ562_02395 [Candidatus Marinimicrobia bacterium]|nr:hypothetical protein [Candidatus Neomarinimicrobiota bacterium]
MIDDLQNHFNRIINEQNRSQIQEFEGYSPDEMEFILYDIFNPGCPVQLVKLADSEYHKIPLLNQANYLADMIATAGELKLTNSGYLPPKIVIDLYSQGYLKEEFIEAGITKLNRESASNTITLTRILLTFAGVIKKRKNMLSLTVKGSQILSDKYQLLRSLFLAFSSKFNWAYFDGYGQNIVGQFGFGFSLVLLSKYGIEKRPDSFYADRYFKAFPQLIDHSIKPRFSTVEDQHSTCYSLRTFDRFLAYWGLIKIEQEKKLISTKYISKTELFDQLIVCLPHRQSNEYN